MRWLNRAKLRTAWLGVLLIESAALGCGDDSPQVPFKLGPQGAALGKAALTPAQADPAQGESYPVATQRIQLRGHSIALATHTFRAALEADLNADGKRDALLLLQNERGVPVLAVALADAEGLGSVDLKGALVSHAGQCEMPTANVSRLSNELALVRTSIACGVIPLPSIAAPPAPPEPENAAPSPAAPANAQSTTATGAAPAGPLPHDFLVRIDPELPIAERLIVLADTEPSSASIGVAWSASDLDGDEHTDVTLTLTLTPPDGAQPTEIALPMLDRPGGFARDASQLETAWLALADESKLARKGQPEKAYALAARVRVAHDAVCREHGVARIELSGSRGIECGPSLAAGRASTIELAGLARKGQLREALRLYAAVLDPSVYLLTPNDRERVTFALGEPASAIRFRRGASLTPAAFVQALPAKPPKRNERSIDLAFVDEEHVLVDRDGRAQTYDLLSITEDAGSDTPLAHATVLALSPSGNRLAVIADDRIYIGDLPAPSAVPVPTPSVTPAPTPTTALPPPAPPEPTDVAR